MFKKLLVAIAEGVGSAVGTAGGAVVGVVAGAVVGGITGYSLGEQVAGDAARAHLFPKPEVTQPPVIAPAPAPKVPRTKAKAAA